MCDGNTFQEEAIIVSDTWAQVFIQGIVKITGT